MSINKEETLETITTLLAMSSDDPKYREIARKLPVPPEVAIVFKENFGVDYIKELGDCDFSLVIEKYGENWLEE